MTLILFNAERKRQREEGLRQHDESFGQTKKRLKREIESGAAKRESDKEF